MDGGCGACQIVNTVYLQFERIHCVVTNQFEFRVIEEMNHILPASGKVIGA